MTQHILIVDADEAFATLLKEGVEQAGDYRAIVVGSGAEALKVTSSTRFDLAIVDLGLKEPEGAAVARALRRDHPDLRLMLIPLDGETLPREVDDLDVQGVLPKPFFLPELPERLAAVLSPPTAQPSPTALPLRRAPPDVERLAWLREHFPQVVHQMNALAKEVNADAVILTYGNRVIAHAGRLGREAATALAQAVAASWETSARVAQILGREQLRFEQSTEGGDYLLYSLAVFEDIILSAALHTSTALGMIRHQARETAEALRALIASGGEVPSPYLDIGRGT